MQAIILEDEEIISKVLKKKIGLVAPDIEIVAILPSLKTARRWLSEHATPDLIFMDIQLSDGVSFDLFDSFEIKCPIVFVSAYNEYAIRAFKVNGVDYLLKPVKNEELEKAIEKCRKLITSVDTPPADLETLIKSLTNPTGASKYKQKFIVKIRNQYMPINVSEIACFCKEALNFIYLNSGDRYVLDYETLDEIEDLIDPNLFYRANRQCIINIEAVQTIKPVENSKLIIKLKSPNHQLEIDMSRLKSPEFRKWLDR